MDRVGGFRQNLTDILSVNATLVNQAQNEEIKRLTEASFEQNEEIKKVSAWAAILFAPTLIASVYGMNFTKMPELHWAFGYPYALGLMALTCAVLTSCSNGRAGFSPARCRHPEGFRASGTSQMSNARRPRTAPTTSRRAWWRQAPRG